jgi:hypothetical protein
MSNMQAIHRDLIHLLEHQKAKIQDDIRSYPPPIPACDAQFNYLLEKRDRLSIDLNCLYQLTQSDAEGLIDFLENSTAINSDIKERFLQDMQVS